MPPTEKILRTQYGVMHELCNIGENLRNPKKPTHTHQEKFSWPSTKNIVTLVGSGAVFNLLGSKETWLYLGEKSWQGVAYTANALWTHYLGSLIYNSSSYVNRILQNWYLLPIQRLPSTNVGEISFAGIRLPNWTNAKEFLSGFRNITQELASSIESFSDRLSDSSAKVFYVSGSACLTLYILYSGLKLGFKYLDKTWIDSLRRPILSRDYKMDDRISNLYEAILSPIRWIYEGYPEKKAGHGPTPIFNTTIESKMDEMVDAITQITDHKGSFYNVLLWGPPGTGKTMGAKAIAERAQVNYIEISGSDIIKFSGSNTHPVALLNQVFTRMKASNKPVILFIDELDAIGLHRARLDPSRVEILNALLNLTGEPSRKIILLGATNRPEDLDAALLSRFSEKWHIAPPEDKERLEMLRMYVHYFFEEPQDLQIFTTELLDQLNRGLKGQTGRSIYALVNKWSLKKQKGPHFQLSKEIILNSTLSFLEEQKALSAQCISEL